MLEAFVDFPIIIRRASHFGKYKYDVLMRPVNYPRKLTREQLDAYVERLRKKYPEKGFRGAVVEIDGEEYYVIRRDPPDLKNPPIYVRLKDGRIFVPRSYVEREPRLTAFVVYMRAYDMGVRMREGRADVEGVGGDNKKGV